jgi:hypothetical protein
MPVSLSGPVFGSHFRVTISKKPEPPSGNFRIERSQSGTLTKNMEFQRFIGDAFYQRGEKSHTRNMSPFPPVESNVGPNLFILATPERTDVLGVDDEERDRFAEGKIQEFIAREQAKPENSNIRYSYQVLPDSPIPDLDTLRTRREHTIREAKAEGTIREAMRRHGLTVAQVIALLKGDV